MKVAVLIPVYNAERYLAECLDSVLAAGHYLEAQEGIAHTLEIFCCDDGSADCSRSILMEYSLRHPEVHFVAQANAGVVKTRNRLMDELPAEFDAFAFVDSDDLVRPTMYARLAEALERTGADVAESGMPGREVEVETVIDDLSVFWLRRTAPGPWINVVNKLYRRSAVAAIRFREGLRFEEDFFFNYEVHRVIRRKVLLPGVDYDYRTNAASATRRLDLRRYLESATLRLRLSYVEFFVTGRIPESLRDEFRQEWAKDAYRMCLRKNLKKNRDAAERRQLFLAAGDFLRQMSGEFGLTPAGLNLLQRRIWNCALSRQYGWARFLIRFT